MKPFTPTTPLAIGSEAVVSWPYSGKECAENKQSGETGYLKLDTGDEVTILSPAEAGHTTNAFPFYVYCQDAKGDSGWVPQLILHRDGQGVFAVITGLVRNIELNETLVRLVGTREDLGRCLIALREV